MTKLLVPPIVVPMLLAIGILAYGLLRAPTPGPDPSSIVLESRSPASK